MSKNIILILVITLFLPTIWAGNKENQFGAEMEKQVDEKINKGEKLLLGWVVETYKLDTNEVVGGYECLISATGTQIIGLVHGNKFTLNRPTKIAFDKPDQVLRELSKGPVSVNRYQQQQQSIDGTAERTSAFAIDDGNNRLAIFYEDKENSSKMAGFLRSFIEMNCGYGAEEKSSILLSKILPLSVLCNG